MVKYLIHTCNSRNWYVQEHLIPSLLEQQIEESDILVYLDAENEGNLQSFIKSTDLLDDEGDTWHLQDDVLICRDFRERTEQHYDTELVCGFASRYDKDVPTGKQKGIDNFWYSFPCIRIPNMILKHFVIWFYSYLQNDVRFEMWLRKKKNDDLLFRYFLDTYYKNIEAINVAPNLVEHIDWLIGGSLVNKIRGDEIIRSIYWEDENIVEELKKKLSK